MSTEKSATQTALQSALEQINAEWKAFQTAHKILPKPLRNVPAPKTYGQSYGQGSFWSHAEQIADSQKLNEIDKLKG